ncbi:MAG TPA: 2-isopropylmalate synthase [bacterium]|nr:2-isopropylmalate synthase [bacterium]HPO51232.1 2-isopropylmalate synthase [bacterium]
MDRIIFFDTTLRDGEQSPGASLTSSAKLTIARHLARLNVDVIEAGFPVASEDDAYAVKLIGKEVNGPAVCALARCVPRDVEVALKSLESARKPRLHLFLATSEIHRKFKLVKAKSEIIRIARDMVKFAKKFIDDIEFSPEDATRTESDFLFEVCQTVVEEGARTLNIPDTVGYAVPEEYGALIGFLREKFPPEIVISVHCHNDLGLAVANSLTAVKNGARQVECTINGIGERAGNASLEEIAMNLIVRKKFYGVDVDLDTKHIYRISKLVSSLTGIPVQPNKAIVGDNAFKHESGIHQDGVIKCRETYEIMHPKMVGIPESTLVLGKHSGRHALKLRLESLGVSVDEKTLNKIFEQFKTLADKKKEVNDLDLIVLAEQETLSAVEPVYTLEYFHIVSGTSTLPSATVRIRKKDEILEDASLGDGPIDALYRAIDRIVKISPKLHEYKIAAVTGGKDAQGEVIVSLIIDGVRVAGKGVSTDIIEASARAYLNAINQYLTKKTIIKKKYRGT